MRERGQGLRAQAFSMSVRVMVFGATKSAGVAVMSASSDLGRARVGVALTFLLTGAVFATWAARVPAIKRDLDLSDGQIAVAFAGLNAGAIVGLQVGSVLVPRIGSRPALRIALPAFALALIPLALAWDLVTLTAMLFVSAAANSVVDVGMNTHGVAVEQRAGRPLLSGLHAMHPLGGIAGAGIAAGAALAAIGTFAHFGVVAVAVSVAAVIATRLLLPASTDSVPTTHEDRDRNGSLTGLLRGWSSRSLMLGVLAFCVTLAEGGVLDWGAVYLHESLGASSGLAAAGVGVFLVGVTLGRFAGDGLILRYGPVAMFRIGSLLAGIGFGVALAIGTPTAGIAGLGILGFGISYLLPLLISTAGKLPGEEAAVASVVARVSTLAYLGSFVGPALIGSTAGVVGLTVALAVPAVLVGVTTLAAAKVAPPA